MNQLRSQALIDAFLEELRGSADFIDLGAIHVNSQRAGGNTPLKIATVRGDAALVAALIDAGARVNAINEDGVTALHHAVAQGHLAVTQLLLNAGADRHVEDRYGNLPEGYAESDAMRRTLAGAGATH